MNDSERKKEEIRRRKYLRGLRFTATPIIGRRLAETIYEDGEKD